MYKIIKYIDQKIKYCEDNIMHNNLNGDWRIATLYEHEVAAYKDVLNYINKIKQDD